MEDFDKVVLEAGIQLATLTVSRTASSINTRIKAIKNTKNIDAIRNGYEEIISELIAEKEEAVRIAMLYKNEVERIQISDDDIEHLHNTISNVIELANDFNVGKSKMGNAQVDSIKAIISKDTLKAMQLLGFNYKEAIGIPLTEASANFISRKLGNNIKGNNKK